MTQQPPQPPMPVGGYADVFDLTLGAYGASFRFGVNGPVIQQGAQQVQQVEITTRVFMSLEHLKALAYVVHREVIRHEKKMGIVIPLADSVITQLLYPPPPNMTPVALEAYMTSMSPVAMAEWKAFWQDKGAMSPNGAAKDPAAIAAPGF